MGWDVSVYLKWKPRKMGVSPSTAWDIMGVRIGMNPPTGTLFLVFGALLGAFGTAWGLYFWDKSIRTGIPASTGTVMVAVLPVILGFQLLLQALAYDIQKVPKTGLLRRKRIE